MLKALLFVAGVYLTLAATALLLADRMIFLPPPTSYTHSDLPIFFIPVGDGDALAAVHLHHPRATHTILYSHGNAEDLGQLRGLLEWMWTAGFSVLAYDYRGYGLSTGGRANSKSAVQDAIAVYRYARQELGIEASSMIVHGRSVGSGPATALAAAEPVAGLILESAFTSAFGVVLPFRLLPFDRFRNLKLLPQVSCPVLVLHGSRDKVIAPDHARRLFDAAPGPKTLEWIEDAGHNDLVQMAGPRYLETLRRFAATLVQADDATSM
jgi:abhydrolase domain-containing protein 17